VRVAHDILRTLLELLEVFRPALTRPGFANLLVVFAGWVQTSGPHAVTQALVAAGVAGRRHHEAFHRFFSRGSWSPDELGRLLFGYLLHHLAKDTAIRIVLDDTVAPKKGPHVFGIGSHVDAVRSTRKRRIFVFGHCWVVLAVLVQVPFSRRPWALPLLLRLYRTEKECLRKKLPHRKKTQLARDMIDVVLTWTGERSVEIAADAFYCNDTLLNGLPSTVTWFGAMRPDAVLTALPERELVPRRGRRRIRGEAVPKPKAIASDGSSWLRTTAFLYGRQRTIYYKTLCAQWYRVYRARLVRIVIVRVDDGDLKQRVFFSTNPSISVRALLEGYAGRWNIEVCFRELKQLLGFADSSARKRAAVERTAPFVSYIYSMLVIWAATGAYRNPAAAPPLRPWYRHKRGLAFTDILRAAQRALRLIDILDPRRNFDDLRESPHGAGLPSERRIRLAA
jgi:hypothetical protein